MRILAVSVAPLFPDFIMGGSQRVLMDVLSGLGEAGHEVRAVCSLTAGNEAGFSLAENVAVEPSLRLKGSFPAPYETSPNNLASTWNALRQGGDWADRIYLHADAIHMRSALGARPLIRSLHDFIYEEALLSAFTLQADRTIVPSEYLLRCISASAGVVTDLGQLVSIPNGVHVSSSRPAPNPPEGVSPREPNDVVLLHPHRLQPRKGLRESMRIAAELKRRMPDRRLRLLVPAFPPGESLDEATDSVEQIRVMAQQIGIDGVLEPHSWLSPGDMPGYYAFGDVTLCPGSFIESFGLVPVESVAAGTPAVCSRVGAFRDLEGLPGISHADYAAIDRAAEAVISFLESPPDPARGRAEIARRFDHRTMIESFVTAITGPLQETRPRKTAEIPGETDYFSLAPWCHISGDRIYHDYLAKFDSFPRLTETLRRSSGRVKRSSKEHELSGEFERALGDGFLVAAG